MQLTNNNTDIVKKIHFYQQEILNLESFSDYKTMRKDFILYQL